MTKTLSRLLSRPLILLLLAATGNACSSEPYSLFDQDGDLVPAGLDCDDHDPSIQSRYADADGDGYGTGDALAQCDTADTAHVATKSGDCDDEDADTYPGADEICDDKDNDCDDDIDEDLELITEYLDADHDGYGAGNAQSACALEDGFASNNADCDDSNSNIHPNAPETCDGTDEDCDGTTDEDAGDPYYRDGDQDGYGDVNAVQLFCSPPPGDSGFLADGSDCNDSDPTIHPGADELCNDIDDDCDTRVDEGLPTYWLFRDQDGDGYGDERKASRSCHNAAPSSGYVSLRGDCNDDDPNFHPGANDVALGDDKDCGGTDGSDPYVVPDDTGILDRGRRSPNAARSTPGSVPADLITYHTIQDAIDAAEDGNVIWVEPGTYPDTVLNFQGKAIKVKSTGMADVTFLEGKTGGGGEAAVVSFASGESSATLLDGFTIRGGTNTSGGGVSIKNASPVIQNCTITSNDAQDGGGINIVGSGPNGEAAKLSALLIQGNTAQGRGGGMFISNANPFLDHCVFEDNESTGDGGGIYLEDAGVTLKNVIITENASSSGTGGAVHVAGDSAAQAFQAFNVAVISNTAAESGGGFYLAGTAGATIENCLFSDDLSGAAGGAIHIEASDLALANSVFRRNKAVNGNDIYFADSSDSTVVNTILASEDPQLAVSPSGSPSVLVAYSDIYPESFAGTIEGVTLQDNVMKSDPKFVKDDAEYPDLWLPHLSQESSLIDAGDPGLEDADTTRSDMGCFGGPRGNDWDLDGDGCPGWFWTGSYDDPPGGVLASSYDSDDLNPLTNPCAD